MMNGKCKDCGHGSIQHYSHFNKHILNPIQRDGYAHDGRRAMFTLKNEILDKCLLRRTKETRAEDMNLPPRNVTIKAVRLHPVEEDFYNALYTQTTSSFNDYVADGTLLNNYAHIFDCKWSYSLNTVNFMYINLTKTSLFSVNADEASCCASIPSNSFKKRC
jgi:DNA repair protein RAD16